MKKNTKVSAFTVTIVNPVVGGTSSPYLLFDGAGVNREIVGNLWKEAKANYYSNATASVDPSVLDETTKSQAIKIKGFNYQVENASDFSNTFVIADGEIDGKQKQVPNVIAKAKRNTQFDSTLLTIDEEILIDEKTAIFLYVTNSTTVQLTFFVEYLEYYGK